MTEKNVRMGEGQIDLVCPQCGDTVPIAVEFATVYSVSGGKDEAGVGTLKLSTKAGKVAHYCEQGSLGV